MEDRFRFRAWDSRLQVYAYDVQGISIYDRYEDFITFFRYVEKDNTDVTLEQCTGLKDKNGKLIYEGDVVSLVPKIEKIKYVVKWDEYNAQLFLDALNKRVRIDFNTIDLKLEVVGNIHENPELLEED